MKPSSSISLALVRLAALVLFSLFVLPNAPAYAATLVSDKYDYFPGDTVVLAGNGWLPGETVQIVVAVEPLTHENVLLFSLADDDGNFINDDYVVRDDDFGVTFTATATGLTSGITESAVFTDAACGNGNVQPNPPNSEQCDDNNTTDGDGCSSTCTIEPGWKCTTSGTSICVLACGDNIVDPGEECDGGSCCTASCTFVTGGTTCRSANGLCDVPETCTGSSSSCPADGYASSTITCRPQSGDCDVAEACTGSSPNCPADAKQSDGTSCDDENLCNIGEACQAGACTGGSAKDCSGEGDQCNDASCDPAGVMEGNCDTQTPTNEGDPCDDGDVCNVGETCQTGSCTGGSAKDCSGEGDQCNDASCDSSRAEGNCDTKTPANEGDPCDDGDVCNVGETCQTGSCTGGSAKDCSGEGDQCNDASCGSSGAEGNCDTKIPANEGGPCDDGDACTENEACQSGTCANGTDVDCDDGTSCTTDSCDSTTACVNEPDDDVCDDNNVCTADACDPDAVGADALTGCDYSLDAESGCEAAITSSSLCRFDIDPDTDPDNQFRLIFTPDPSAPSSWKLNASNPGQFYYNAMYVGSGEETLEIELPYPFVTQGANPVHLYAAVTPEDDGCYTPSDEIGSAKTLVALEDYAPPQIGSTTVIGVELPSLAGHFAYVNVHLDYGLKKTPGYSKNAGNDAVDAANLANVLIPDETDYEFSDSFGGTDIAQSNNVFKRDPGFAGLVLDNTLTPVVGVKVEIRDSTGKLLKTVLTDTDGWYMWQYKHTGKAATYTIALPDYLGQLQSVTLKSNQLVTVNFELP
jgi:cysteine-rich repeat protein